MSLLNQVGTLKVGLLSSSPIKLSALQRFFHFANQEDPQLKQLAWVICSHPVGSAGVDQPEQPLGQEGGYHACRNRINWFLTHKPDLASHLDLLVSLENYMVDQGSETNGVEDRLMMIFYWVKDRTEIRDDSFCIAVPEGSKVMKKYQELIRDYYDGPYGCSSKTLAQLLVEDDQKIMVNDWMGSLTKMSREDAIFEGLIGSLRIRQSLIQHK